MISFVGVEYKGKEWMSFWMSSTVIFFFFTTGMRVRAGSPWLIEGFNDLSYFLKVEKNTIYTIYLAINGLGNEWERTSYCK
jgi:hypothetical protein